MFLKMDHMKRVLDLIAVGSKTAKPLPLMAVSCSLGKTFGTRQNFWNLLSLAALGVGRLKSKLHDLLVLP